MSFQTVRDAAAFVAGAAGACRLIGIDGWTGAGKTLLGKEFMNLAGTHRFLDLDCFVRNGQECYLAALDVPGLTRSLGSDFRAFVISGVCLLDAVELAGFCIDLHIYLKRMDAGIWADEANAVGDGLAVSSNAGFPTSQLMWEVHSYHRKRRPHESADLIVELEAGPVTAVKMT